MILEGDKERTGSFNFRLHEFTDNTSRLQLLNQPTQTNFYNIDVETSEDKVVETRKLTLMTINFSLGPKKVVFNRRVYDSLDFLGDAGGIFGSMVLLGQAFHFFISQNEQAFHFLKNHFLVDKKAPKSQPTSSKSPLKRLSVSVLDQFLLSTFLHYFSCCLTPCLNKRRKKLIKYMAAADQAVETTLDVRRLFKIERLLSGLSRIVLDD